MNTHNEKVADKKPERVRALNQDHGFFHTCTISRPPMEVYEFCRKRENIMLILEGLPQEIQKLLKLELLTDEAKSTSSYEVTWKNSDEAKLSFMGSLYISPATNKRGTVLAAEAFFEVPGSKILSKLLNFDEPEPSMLVSIFLRRLKAQLETGEIATTKGQPSGREENEKNNFLH